MTKAVLRKRIFWWGLAIAYIALTYATLGVMPRYWYAIDGLLSGHGIYFQYFLYSAVGIAVLAFLHTRGFFGSIGNLAVTGVVIAAFAMMFHLEKNPGEKIHMFQYGVLGWLLFKALKLHFDTRSKWLYLAGGLACLSAGALDEVIQGMLPNRTFTLHDIVVNGLSGVIVQLYVYFYYSHQRSASRAVADVGP